MKSVVVWVVDGGLVSQGFATEDDAAEFVRTLSGVSVVVGLDSGAVSCWGVLDGVYPLGGFGGEL